MRPPGTAASTVTRASRRDTRPPAAERVQMRRAVRGPFRGIPTDSKPPTRPQPCPDPPGRLSLVGTWCQAGQRWPRGCLGTRHPRGLRLDSVPVPRAPTASPVKRHEPGEPTGDTTTSGCRGAARLARELRGCVRRGEHARGTRGSLQRRRAVSWASRYFCPFWRQSPGSFKNSSVGQNNSLQWKL